jgi:hypothetical protein
MFLGRGNKSERILVLLQGYGKDVENPCEDMIYIMNYYVPRNVGIS